MPFFMNRWTVSAIALTVLLALNTGGPYLTAPQIVLTLSVSGAYVSLGLFGIYLIKRGACALLRPLVRTQPPEVIRSASTSDFIPKKSVSLFISDPPFDKSLLQDQRYNLRSGIPSRQKRRECHPSKR